jgi:hypothetical protein
MFLFEFKNDIPIGLGTDKNLTILDSKEFKTKISFNKKRKLS